MKTGNARSVLLIAVSLACFYAIFAPSEPGFVSDSNFYLAGAESLAESGQYRLITHVGSPWFGLYPPLQSAYLSLFWRLAPAFPANLWLLNCAMVFLLVGSSVALFLLLRGRGVPAVPASLLSLAFGLSPTLFFIVFAFFSDLLFAGLTFLLALVWLYPNELNRRWFISGLLLSLMYLTRTAAVGMFVPFLALAGWSAIRMRRPWPIIFVLGPVGVAFCLWNVLIPHETPTYVDLLVAAYRGHSGWYERGWTGYGAYVGRQTLEYVSGGVWLRAFTPRFEAILIESFPHLLVHSLVLAMGLCFMLLAGYGYFRDTWEWKRPALLILLSYSAQLILWPWRLDGRMLLPILPFALIWSIEGGQHLPGYLLRFVRLASASVLLLILLFNLVGSIKESEWMSGFGEVEELRELARQVSDQIPVEARIEAGTDLPLFQFFHSSGHRVPFFQYGPTGADNVRCFEYLLLWHSAHRASRPVETVLKASGSNYELVRVQEF